MSGAGPAVREHGAAAAESAAGSPSHALEELRASSAQGWQLLAALGGKWAQRAAAFARSLVRPRLMRQAVAAARRGNLDAAFALLREEVSERPGVQKSTLLFWGVALACERAPEAAAPMARLVRDEAAAGRVAAALDQWLALVAEVPGAVLDVATLSRIVPVLRTRYSEARGEAAQQQARERLIDALRRSVDPASGALTVGIALRLVEEARGLDADVARRAAEAALASSGLHEAKRARLGELLRSLDEGRWPEAPVTAPPVPAAPRPPPPVPVRAVPPPAPPAPVRALPPPAPPAPVRALPRQAPPAPAPALARQAPPPAPVVPSPAPAVSVAPEIAAAAAPKAAPAAFVVSAAPTGSAALVEPAAPAPRAAAVAPAPQPAPAAALPPVAKAPPDPSPRSVDARPEPPVAVDRRPDPPVIAERRPAPPILAVATPGALRAVEITPVELAADGLVAWEVGGEQRTRVHYRAIEAIAAAEVAGLAEAGVIVIDLVLRSTRPGRPRSSLRMRSDSFDPATLFPERSDAGQALRSLLSELLDRSGALPLPDPDSALALRPQRFESLAAFEAATLARLSH